MDFYWIVTEMKKLNLFLCSIIKVTANKQELTSLSLYNAMHLTHSI